MKEDISIYDQGIEQYSKVTVIFGNFMMLLWIALGTIACRFLCPLVAWIYFAFAIIMVYVVLRKLVCTNCYYYGKLCAMGWGKLSALLFKKGNIKDFKTSIGVKLAPLTYGLLSIIPLILVVISIFLGFSIFKIVILVLLLLVSFYSGAISRKKTCAECKMKLMCPGSAEPKK